MLGAVVGLAGIAIAWVVWVRRPGSAGARARAPGRACTRCSSTSGTSTALYDAAIVAPGAGRWGASSSGTFERVVVDRGLIGGATTGIVRPAPPRCAPRRPACCACYAALLVIGLAVVGLYFLLVA